MIATFVKSIISVRGSHCDFSIRAPKKNSRKRETEVVCNTSGVIDIFTVNYAQLKSD
jgi:hypothetical protein